MISRRFAQIENPQITAEKIRGNLRKTSAQICGKNLQKTAGKKHCSQYRKRLLQPVTENEISYLLRGCIFKVYNNLGPGLLESAYSAALRYEIEKTGLQCASQVALPMIYETAKVDVGYRLDLLIENKVIIEIKSVEMLAEVHHKQVITI